PFRLFDGLMTADWLPATVKRDFCRGLLGCQTEEQQLRARSAEIRAYFQSGSYESAHLPRMALEVSLIGLRLMLPGLQRHAVHTLVELGEPAHEVIEEFLLRAKN